MGRSNILLVGATGQIGDAILGKLLRTDHTISVLVRQNPSYASGRLLVIKADEFDKTAFRRALSKIDHVIYCLGMPEQFAFKQGEFSSVNVDLMSMFIEEMITAGKRSLTYISTYEIFQAANDGTIEETAQISQDNKLSAYFKSMIFAYKAVKASCDLHGIALTTIHPSAVYGGLNTGYGVTDYMANIAQGRVMKTPFIIDGQFPVIHVQSLADGVLRSLGKPGAYLFSDCMTSLKEIAQIIKLYVHCRVPITLPLSMVKTGASILEVISRVGQFHPIISNVQIEYITKGHIPKTSKAEKDLGWVPIPLEQGIQRYLTERLKLLVL